MMKTILVRLSKGATPPGGNPFLLRMVKDVTLLAGDVGVIDTGLDFRLPDGTWLTIQSTEAGLFVLGWQIEGGSLKVAVIAVDNPVNINAGAEWGIARIDHREPEKVRFAEMGEGGGRIIRGEARPVKSGD